MGSPRRRIVSEPESFGSDEEEVPTPRPANVGVRRAREVVSAAPAVRELDPHRRDEPQRRDPGRKPDGTAPSAEPYARGRELAALLFVAVAVFVTLGLASYDERGGADWVGPVGARFASLVVSAFGLGGWAIPIELALFGLPYLRRRPSVITPARLAGDVVLIGTAAALIHVGAGGRPVFGGALAGGVIGELFGEVLRSLFSTVGTFLVGLTTIALVLIARATFSFIAFANRAAATSAAAASNVALSAKGVAEAWHQAKELERGTGRPAIVSADGDLGSDRISFPADPPSGAMVVADDRSGVRAMSELRMRDDGGGAKETHAIARQLVGADPATDSTPSGVVAAAAPVSEIAPPIILDAGESDPDRPRRKRGKDCAPTIAPVSPDAAVQRAVEAPPAPPNVETAAPTASPPSEGELPAGQLMLPLESDTSPEPAPVAKRRKQTTRIASRGYKLPSTELLEPPPPEEAVVDRAQLLEDAKALVQTLATYKVIGEVREIHPGPVVTTFELEPRIGTKVREVEGLANDLRLSLAKESVRIIAPIPGKNRIGFELPNQERIPVNFRELVEDRRFAEAKGQLPVILGRDIVGAPFYADLAAMPHLLVAGATGAGKSVGLNVMLTSLLYRRSPEDLRMIMIDPKVVELAPFDRIPHMLLPVVTDMKQALNALKWCVDEMERRYQLLASAGVKNITSYNAWRDRVLAGTAPNPCPRTMVATDHNNLPEEIVCKDPDPSVGEQQFPEKLPFIVVVVDEFADLMMSVGKGEVEPPIARLAQKARAAGIHVILATQRPSVDVITGMIKANFPTRIAFRVAQRVDSRTILDAQGAEYLLGKGDMLVSLNGGNGLKRIQCPFVSEEEVQRVTDMLRAQGEPVFDESILAPRPEDAEDDGEDEALSPKDQELFDRCVEMVREARKCSTSWLQRKMGLGYNKAARFVDRMERTGVVGPPVGAGKDREVMG
ncbi:MAG: hypothetical protein NVSMB47_03510 [Polyangiales bacterium]